MSDHQFQEREFEAAGEHINATDLMDLLLGGQAGLISGSLGPQQMRDLLESLPRLTEPDLVKLGHADSDSTCPVCITPFPAILAEEEMALVMESPAHAFEEMGVTRLWIDSRDEGERGCGHLFCRRCISKWIGGGHDSCPTCRRFLAPKSDSNSGSPSSIADPIEENALRQLQHQMRTFRSMLGSDGLPTYIAGEENAESQDGPSRGTTQQENARDDYAGMYS